MPIDQLKRNISSERYLFRIIDTPKSTERYVKIFTNLFKIKIQIFVTFRKILLALYTVHCNCDDIEQELIAIKMP